MLVNSQQHGTPPVHKAVHPVFNSVGYSGPSSGSWVIFPFALLFFTSCPNCFSSILLCLLILLSSSFYWVPVVEMVDRHMATSS
jgi:hypothetical protein